MNHGLALVLDVEVGIIAFCYLLSLFRGPGRVV